jgi:hypothetical protein
MNVVLEIRKKSGLEKNADKSGHVRTSRHRPAGHDHYTVQKKANKFVKIEVKFKYMGINVINQNFIHEKLKAV